MLKLWEERYSGEKFAYGKEPNKFFKAEIEKLIPGRLLMIGEGEGRNAVYAAKLGWNVDAIDYSEMARKKAMALAAENNILINYEINDLSLFEPKEDYYDAIGIIYIHLDEELRRKVHLKVIKSLKENGCVILEAFEKKQIKNSSGGPKNIDLLYSLEDIVSDFIDLEFIKLDKENVSLDEGDYHVGEADVVRFIGKKVMK
jgi:SAM-dependent methyltransferase